MTVVCFIIHGIGEQNQKFASPLKKGIRRELHKLKNGVEAGRKLEFHDLYWADQGSSAQDNLYSRIYPHLYSKEESWWESTKQLGVVRSLTFGLIGDIFKYLGKFQKPIKQAVVETMGKVFKEKQEANEPFSLVLIGHSLGTVILHDLITGFLEYHYAAFDGIIKSTSVFTMGSPISLFSLVTDTADPSRFRKWTNFLHPTDPIALPMANRFPKGVADVELKKPFQNPLTSHGMYWTHAEVHKQIAAEILEHVKKGIGVVLPAEALRNEVPPEIYQPFQTSATNVGFSQYLPDFNGVPFEKLFTTKKQIDICLLYGETWLKTHGPKVVSALEKHTTDMRVCLVSPKSPAIAGIAYQFSVSEEEVRNRAQKSTEAFKEIFATAKKNAAKPGHLRIYHSLNGINHTFYRFDDLIYSAPRKMSSLRLDVMPIPTIVFRGKYPPKKKDETGYDMYSWLMQDYETLLANPKGAELVFDSQK
jgi:hypothetical protein